MAYNKVTIDVEARFIDSLTSQAGSAGKKVDDLGDKAEDAGKKVDDLGDKAQDAGKKVDDAGKDAQDAGKGFTDAGNKAQDAGKKVDDLGDKAQDAGKKVDDLGKDAQDAGKKVDDLGDKAEDAGKKVDDLGKKKAEPEVGAKDNRFVRIIKAADERLKRFAHTTASAALHAIDRASSVISKVTDAVRSFSGKVYEAIVKVRDSGALTMLSNLRGYAKDLAGKVWTVVVKAKDLATAPLRAISRALFNIKTLFLGIVAGAAANKFIAQPIALADQYSSARIGFQTLLGDERGQQMMDDLDKFAKETPFNTSQVIGQAQKMIAMGWDAENIINDMQTIGDAAAATGKGDEGLGRIVLALSQIKSKGKLSTEELNQLAEAGISAKRYIAEGLGYGSGDEGLMAMTKDLEKGAIGAEAGIQALIEGMKEYNGMMNKTANETVSGISSQIADAFEINIFRRWGQGLQDGARRGFGSVIKLLDESEEGLKKVGDILFDIGSKLSGWFADRMETAIATITELTGTEEFQNASLAGKIGILWDGVVADPLKEWWENGGRDKAAETAEKAGKWLGETMQKALLGIFGATNALNGENGEWDSAGAGIAESFVHGFLENFDGQAITDALKDAITNVWNALPTWAKVLVGGYAASAAGGAIQSIAGGLSTVGGVIGGAAGGAAKVAGGAARIIGSTGNYMVNGTGIMGGLANAGYALIGGPATAGAYFGAGVGGGTAAAIGAGSIAGGLLGAAGIGSGVYDIYQGTQLTGKERKDKLFIGGTKIGMVGAGAAGGAAAGASIGAAFGGVGAVPGALIGAGIGGIGALLGGSKIGKALSDLTDSIPEAVGNVKETVSQFFTETVPEKFDELLTGISEFFTEKVPYAIGYAAGKIAAFFTETLPQKWDELWNTIGAFFTEGLPQWASDTWNNKIVPFFTQTVPEKWDAMWSAIDAFFTETVPTWASDIWTNKIVPFFTETVPEKVQSLWTTVTGFFTEGLPAIAQTIWDAIKSFFTDTIPGWISQAISSVGGLFGGIGEKISAGFSAGRGGRARGGLVAPAGMNAPGFAAGGLVRGGGRLVRVAEEGSPEMIIPLSSQRRQRGIQLWERTGRMLGVPGFAAGGLTSGQPADDSLRSSYNDAGGGTAGGQSVQIEIAGITFEIHVDGDGGGSGGIAEAIRAQAEEIADTVAGILADAFNGQFENTPLRGGT